MVDKLAHQNPTLTRIVKSWSQSLDLSSNDANEILARSQELDISSIHAVALRVNNLPCLFSEMTLINSALTEYNKQQVSPKEPKFDVKSIWQTSEIECDIDVWNSALMKLSNNSQLYHTAHTLHITEG